MSTSRRTPSHPKDYHHGDLAATLVAAAIVLLSKKGIAGLSLRAAARKAGVSAMAPYRHFADKEALLAAVAEHGFGLFARALRGAGQSGADPFARLRARGVAYVRFALDHPELFRLMFGPEIADKKKYPGLAAAGQDALGALAETIEPCMPGIEAWNRDDVALASWSAMHGLAALMVDGRLGDRPGDAGAAADRVGRMLIEGIRARQSR